MGAMFEAQCTCGYASETLFEGCGMLAEVGLWD